MFNSKKSQVQIQETILVIFIFTVILLIGLIVFYRFTSESIKQDALKNDLFRFYNLIGYLPNIPELKCSSLAYEEECIDMIKAIAFRDINYDLGYRNVTLFILYPETSANKCNRDTIKECNTIDIYLKKPTTYKTTYKTFSPVSLYNPILNKYYLGKLVIEWYV